INEKVSSETKCFCDQCLHPGLVDYINRTLGTKLVDDILVDAQHTGYASRMFFQFTVLQDLLEEMDFDNYVKYIESYEEFVQNWIWKHILEHYAKNEDLKDLEKQILSTNLKNLEKEILSAILKKIKETLENLRQKDGETVLDFLENFCQEMQRDLVISNYNLIGMQFTSSSPQFASCVKKFLPDLQKTLLSDLDILDIESKLSSLSVKPQDEIFKKVFGCGKQCPFCKVPCEAGGSNHKEHFAAVHQPQGLGIYKDIDSEKLVYNLCSTLVASESEFQCEDTDWEWHQFKDYRVYYPDWCIQPDPSINASDYWKFFLKEFNHDLAQHYGCKPADLPEDWKNLTKEHALQALKETYNMKLV
uniref:Interferon-induced very large GTPase 1 n=1 Tax=Varanus komodoensis TaxID=61221 RepID=A0A8D2LP68_VARKO